MGNEAVIGRFGEDGGFDTVELECGQFAVPFDFVVATGGDFVDNVDDAAVHVAGGQDLVEVCHLVSFVSEDLNGRSIANKKFDGNAAMPSGKGSGYFQTAFSKPAQASA